MVHPRDRARAVCTHCHARKVKCDLEDSRDGSCSNCRRFSHSCIKRTRLRKRPKVTASDPPSRRSPESISGRPERSSVVESSTQRSSAEARIKTRQHGGFIAGHSVLAYDEPTQPTVPEGSIARYPNAREAVLAVTEALILPVPSLRRALIDAFFEHVYHSYPVVEPDEVSAPDSPVLLQQAVYLAASLMRHGPDNLKLSLSLYEKVKTLVYLNYEPDNICTLKALCLLSCWSVKPPDKMSLDGPWYWTGVASRAAIQLGLHQESTYTNHPQASSLRRVFWQLHNADKLQIACWGRPPSFSPIFTDVKLPSASDFGSQNVHTTSFLECTKLCTIIGQIAELQLEKRAIDSEESSRLTHALSTWVREVPAELHLYDSATGARNKFNRVASELFILYFAAIILLQHLKGGTDPQQHTSIKCLIASSCMIHLYEEILVREQTCFLRPLNAFLCMVASLPQIYYKPRSAEKKAARENELGVICSVLEQMQGKYGGSEMVLRKVLKLRRNVDASLDAQALESEPIETPSSPVLSGAGARLKDLFPFPASMCGHMDLIQWDGDLEEYSAESFVPMENEWVSWLSTEDWDLTGSLEMYPGMSDAI